MTPGPYRRILLVLTVVLAGLIAGQPSPVAQAATHTFIVTSTADSHDAHPGDGVCADSAGLCTLRSAIEEADALSAGSVILIVVPAGHYLLPLGTLSITANTTAIFGAGARSTVIDGQGQPVVNVASPAAASLARVTITGGSTRGEGGWGGIDNSGTLRLVSTVIYSNTAPGGIGGGIVNSGGLLISSSVVLSNTTPGVPDDPFGGEGGGLANNGGTVTVINSTIAGNATSTDGEGGGLFNNGGMITVINSTVAGNTASFGAGLYIATGNVVFTDSRVSSNTASTVSSTGVAMGGGIYNGGTLTLARSTVSGNAAPNGGGGLANFGTAAVTTSTIAGNTAATGGGGGVFNQSVGTVALTRSAVIGNSSATGGGLYNFGKLALTNTTVGANRAATGGGLVLEAGSSTTSVALNYSTISDNTATTTGGGFYLDSGPSPVLTGTILAGNTPSNCGENDTVIAEGQGYNLDSDGSCNLSKVTDITNTNPLLGPLANNGGPTQTMALLPGSPAIDHGGTTANGCPATDQRGVTRPQGPACDIGAYEAVP